MARAIVFTGKSGAGVSTIAAATALRCAQQGHRTLLLHFGLDLAGEDGALDLDASLLVSEPGLSVQRAGAGSPDGWDWSPVVQWADRFFAERGAAPMPVRMDDLPGVGRLRELLSLATLLDSPHHDCVVIDCPPARETLDLLRVIEGVHTWRTRQRQPEHTLMKLARPLAARLASIPDPDAALAALSDLGQRLARLYDLLSDGSRSSFRLVAGERAADAAVLLHTYRALRLLEYPVDAIVRNCPGNARRADRTRQALVDDDPIAPAVIEAAHEPADPLDMTALGRIADALYGTADPATVLATSPRMALVNEHGSVCLRIPAPITGQHAVGVTQVGDYVTLNLGTVQRIIPLPAAVAGRVCTRATLSGGTLSLTFL